ncbi:MAG: hypothetical protein FJX62_04250 [Alphaproteobacteria bacterium]|nr:hypothetical protein [Alphaproteobacteria bacterium]
MSNREKTAHIVGTEHKDYLKGDANDNVIEGRGGADVIHGGAGNDTASYESSSKGVYVNLDGGNYGFAGQYLQFGYGRGGDAEGDFLISIENVIGSKHNDTFVGNSQDNVFTGGVGNGNNGSDSFVFTGKIGHDTITDFDAVGDDRDYLVFDKNEFKNFDDFKAKTTWEDTGDDVVIHIGDDSITLKNVNYNDLDSREFKFVDTADYYLV